jgi:transketolase
VEATTGPLGQGFGAGVGMGIAQAHLAATYSPELFNSFIFSIVSDGDLMEGVASEAASLAGHLRLGRLIYLYDDNHISIDGSTDLAFTEDRTARFEAYGWHVQKVADGNDVEAIDAAIQNAKADPRPSLIAVRTIIGYGAPKKQGTAKAHGEPLGDEELNAAKDNLGWPKEPRFYIPGDVAEFFCEAIERGRDYESEWNKKVEAYKQANPEKSVDLGRRLKGELPKGWQKELPKFPADIKGMATRAASGKVINALAARLPELIGGSADLAPSNNTKIDGSPDFQKDSPEGRNFHFGVREHGMGAVLNGMTLHGGVIPYGGTFLIFSDYMRAAVRIAALSHISPIFVFTHDSVGLGEDGPTHQPIEHLAGLRAMPNVVLIRPADANETAQAWKVALARRDGPTILALTRQAVPTFDAKTSSDTEKGAYVLASFGRKTPELILMASGSEVSLAYEAAQKLAEEGRSVRVVSFPSWQLFEKQSEAYRESVLPKKVTARISVEAAAGLGWERYVGPNGKIISIERFGASAPYKVIFENLGFTAENILKQARSILPKKKAVKKAVKKKSKKQARRK